jgi:RNA binding exosome subunit
MDEIEQKQIDEINEKGFHGPEIEKPGMMLTDSQKAKQENEKLKKQLEELKKRLDSAVRESRSVDKYNDILALLRTARDKARAEKLDQISNGIAILIELINLRCLRK